MSTRRFVSRAFGLVALLASTAAGAAEKKTGPAVGAIPAPPPVSRTTTTSAVAPSERATTVESGSSYDKRFEIMPMLGYSTDNMNLGLGLRVTRKVTDKFSIGGLFVYQLGESTTAGTPGVPGVTSSASYTAGFSMWYVGPEAGYDFELAPVIIRPYAGVGFANLTASTSGPGVNFSSSSTKFVVWPGAMVLYDVPESPWFVGGDVRMVTVPGGPALGLFVVGGAKL